MRTKPTRLAGWTIARHRRTPATLLAVMLAVANAPALADEPLPPQIDRALDCAALALVATSVAEPSSPQGKLFTQRSMLFRMVYGMLLEDQTHRTATNGEISGAISGRALLLNSIWTHDRKEVLETHRLCAGWIAGIGYRVQAIINNQPSTRQVDAFRQVVRVPLEEAMHHWPEESLKAADQTIAVGFENWRAMGLVTSDTVRKSLERWPVTKQK